MKIYLPELNITKQDGTTYTDGYGAYSSKEKALKVGRFEKDAQLNPEINEFLPKKVEIMIYECELDFWDFTLGVSCLKVLVHKE